MIQTQGTTTIDSAQVNVNNIHHATVSAVPELLLRPTDTVTVDTVQDFPASIIICDDSLMAYYNAQEVHYCESMFAGNGHSSKDVNPQMRNVENGDGWIFGALILLLALTSLYLNNQKFKITEIFQSLFDMRVLDRVFRESNLKPVSLLPMTGIYLAGIGLAALYMSRRSGLNIDFSEPVLYLLMLGGLIVFLFAKNEFIRFFGNLFDDRTTTNLYISSNYLFYFVGGLILTPLLLFLFFSPATKSIVLSIVLGMIAILFIVRVFRSMQLILSNSRNSKLYLFYHLCIFELVPILIAIKVLIS